MSLTSDGLTLRERKRERTRKQLVEVGCRLFKERGYDETTVADIASAAEIGTRTFFAYFDTKEQLLFPDVDPRIDAAFDAIRTCREGETPAQVLLRSLESAAFDVEATSATAELRIHLMPVVPAIQARALRSQLEAQRIITDALSVAYPNADSVELAAVVGAFMGAVAAAFQHLEAHRDAAHRKSLVRRAVTAALVPSG
jgi:AcrR family transcriptional regulator